MADIKYYDVILKPVVTEKATGFEMEEANKYTFLVHVDANKTMIKDLVFLYTDDYNPFQRRP